MFVLQVPAEQVLIRAVPAVTILPVLLIMMMLVFPEMHLVVEEVVIIHGSLLLTVVVQVPTGKLLFHLHYLLFLLLVFLLAVDARVLPLLLQE